MSSDIIIRYVLDDTDVKFVLTQRDTDAKDATGETWMLKITHLVCTEGFL